MLVVVRHARPVVSVGLPPAQWPLSQEGEAAAAALGPVLLEEVVRPQVVSSTEAKALATARACFPHGEIVEDDRLTEVTRPSFDDVEELYREAAAYFDGESPDGWESADAVAERFDRCLSGLGQEGDLVAFTHGTALTVWLSRRFDLREPFRWWCDLRMPDAWVVGSTGAGVTRLMARRPAGPSLDHS